VRGAALDVDSAYTHLLEGVRALGVAFEPLVPSPGAKASAGAA